MSNESNKRRDTPRVEQKATVVARFEGGRHVCLLKNVSAAGAGLMFNPDLHLPGSFELELGAGHWAPCVVAWRRRDRMGVRFKRRAPRPGLETVLAWVARPLRRAA